MDEGMQKQNRSKTASKSLNRFTRKIDNKSCMMYGFYIICKNLDHENQGKKEVSKESSISSQLSDTLVPGMVSISFN